MQSHVFTIRFERYLRWAFQSVIDPLFGLFDDKAFGLHFSPKRIAELKRLCES
jgi:hypothetical protein